MKTLSTRLLLPLAASLLAVATVPAYAGPSRASFAYTGGSPGSATLELNGSTTLTALNRGWVDELGDNNFGLTDGNYIAGQCGTSDLCDGDDLIRNNYFNFDLDGFSDTITSAVLHLAQPLDAFGMIGHNGYISTELSEVFTLWDVFLDPTSSAGVALFDDLGSGISFGSVMVDNSTNGTTVSLTLNGNGLSMLNDQRGSFAFIGGSLGLSNSAPVPEPSTWMMLLAGFGMIGAAMRRRVKKFAWA